MSNKTFELSVVTPEGVALEEAMASVRVPAVGGSMGVLANHAPLVSPLSPGELWMRDANGEERRYAIGEGFIEVGSNKCTVLTDFSDRSDLIDEERAARAAERAKQRLQEKAEDIDEIRARASLARAMVRLRVLGK